jgi:hypothetical protein
VDELAGIERALEAREQDPASWTIAGDGYRDGGTPYTDEELQRSSELQTSDERQQR